MDQEYITRQEHQEFAKRLDTEYKRMEDEDNRQNKRIAILEDSLKEINRLTLQIERMATSIEQVTTAISKQGEKIESMEEKPAKRWESLVSGIIGAIAGAIGTAIAAGLLL